ncbi:MAG: nucleotidyl transferase AbiEii/AbiGii toxin family protein [Acidobacteria bacterium]|nr:nucleotidyl transferase AbiEii/AbiGii toxin family protein [Acidobacteriota bacterium]
MSAGGDLRLPEPARGLWLRTRDAIRTSLDEIGVSEYAIGGGTILAARWKHHRASDDIDLSLPANARLDRLDDRETCGLRKRMEQLGGECDTETHGAVYRIAFGEQGIDLWAHRAEPAGAERRERVEGSEETTLSTVQILWGKLNRGLDGLPRGVYDVATAADVDPEALEVAANAHARRRTERVALHWFATERAIDRQARTRLRGIPADEQAQIGTLGSRASERLLRALYEELVIERHGVRLRMTTRTAAGTRRTRTIDGHEIPAAWERLGLLGHRETRAPMEDIASYAELACRRGGPPELIYREVEGRADAWRTATRVRNLPPGGRT